ncbi:Uncharacterized protein DAT39_006732 [Clarias magur]|uniref:Uncharacterized protein n=1 Tax=Clarias magur TaxID=1594786 RepID=A0A8J4U3T6_CLAMG|nr:Uncharacterized protein DAT39_006732 [Clarias magur]
MDGGSSEKPQKIIVHLQGKEEKQTRIDPGSLFTHYSLVHYISLVPLPTFALMAQISEASASFSLEQCSRISNGLSQAIRP